ncbi:nucleotidyltransferase family protein, partial [Sphingomonas sp. AR_OL41]|uniref:nucleotidyltransferase family protein n=1 Tax=Sphingomonas sp. AR_OL41 TaxID=3042729 RepID=UPI002480E8CE
SDGARLQRVVRRQRVAGLVHGALKAAAAEVPPPAGPAIGHSAAGIIRSSMTGAAETARLMQLIGNAGYPVLTVKGAALAALVYGTITLKHSKDIDLLILPEHAQDVIALLEVDGYHITFPAAQLSPAQRAMLTHYGKDVAMRRPGPYPQLELHWRMFGNRALLPTVTANAPRQTVVLSGGVRVETLALPDLYAYLTVHGTGDGWSRLKWLADLNALLAPLDAATIASLHAHAERLDAGRCSAVSLLLCAELLALPLDAALVAQLRRSRRVRMLANLCRRLMIPADGGAELTTWRGGQRLLLLVQLLMAGGLQYYFEMLRWTLFIQTDLYRSKAPPSLYFLYPLVRLPLWLGRRVGLVAEPRAEKGQ